MLVTTALEVETRTIPLYRQEVEAKGTEVTCLRSPAEGRRGGGTTRGKVPHGGQFGAARSRRRAGWSGEDPAPRSWPRSQLRPYPSSVSKLYKQFLLVGSLRGLAGSGFLEWSLGWRWRR